MTSSILKLGFGYNPVPESAIAAFGARTIYNGRSFDFVPNRCDWAGEDEGQEKLRKLMDESFWDHLQRLAVERFFGYGDSSEVKQGTFNGLNFIASPNSSFGYLYLTVWI
jgi:hypothetical protein